MIGILRSMRRRRLAPLTAALACAVALSACGGADAPSSTAAAAEAGIEPLPTRETRPTAVEPVAGRSGGYAASPAEQPGSEPTPLPAGASATLGDKGKRSSKRGSGPTGDAAISDAEVLKNGIALPPIEAPEQVRRIIEAGNQIARSPYLWGGGHGRWLDKGYDCSGSVSFALAAAGLLSGPLASGPLMSWGNPGKGKWVTIYTNPGHVWMVVAGVRFDTTARRVKGSRWLGEMRSTGGYVARHPPGL